MYDATAQHLDRLRAGLAAYQRLITPTLLPRLTMPTLTRAFDQLAWDENLHPRGAGGKFIGGDGLHAEREAYHLSHALRVFADRAAHASPEEVAQAKARITWRGIQGHAVITAHLQALQEQAQRDAQALHTNHTDRAELLHLRQYYLTRLGGTNGLSRLHPASARLRREVAIIDTQLARARIAPQAGSAGYDKTMKTQVEAGIKADADRAGYTGAGSSRPKPYVGGQAVTPAPHLHHEDEQDTHEEDDWLHQVVRAETPTLAHLRAQLAQYQAQQTVSATRAGGATLHCYHGYFCGGGGVSGAIPDRKPPHALGGVKSEVQLHEHRAGRAAYIAEHGQEAYAQRARQLTTRAKNGAAKLSPEERTALATERDALVKHLSDGKGTKEDQAKAKAEAVMLTTHLGRNQPHAGAKAFSTKVAGAKTPHAVGAKASHAGGATGKGHGGTNGAPPSGGGHYGGDHHAHQAGNLAELLKTIIDPLAGLSGGTGAHAGRAAAAETVPGRLAALRDGLAGYQRLVGMATPDETRNFGGLNGRIPLFEEGPDGKMHFAGSTPGGGKVEIPGVTHLSLAAGKGKVGLKGTENQAAIPHDFHAFASMEKITGPSGSQAGQWYQDTSGHAFYVKPALSEAHAYNEVGAMKAYGAMGAKEGVDIPYTGVVHDTTGHAYIVSQRLEGLSTHSGSWWQSADAAKARTSAARLWAVDVLLSHWDVVGMGHDNLLVNGAGKPVRIEAGGAMAFRAEGATKGSWAVGGTWNEPWTMRGITHEGTPGGTQSGDVFGKITDAEASAHLGNLRDTININKIDAAWQALGMPDIQRQTNIAVIQDRIARIDAVRAQLTASASPHQEQAAPAIPKGKYVWEGVGTWGSWNDKYKGSTVTTQVHSGQAWVVVHYGNGTERHFHIEPDMEYGNYKVTEWQKGIAVDSWRGLSISQANGYAKGQMGVKSAPGSKLLPGAKVFDATMVPPGPKPSKAQQAINQANEAQASAAKYFAENASHHKGAATAWNKETQALEYHHPDGSMDSIAYNVESKTFTITHYPASANPTTTPEQSWWNHVTYGVAHPKYAEHSYVSTPASTKTWKTTASLKTYFTKHGLDSGPVLKMAEDAQQQAKYKEKAEKAALYAAANPPASSVDPHSTTGWKAQYAANTAHGKALIEAIPDDVAVGAYTLKAGQKTIGIQGQADGTITLTLTKNGITTTTRSLSADEAMKALDQEEVDPQYRYFVDMAAHDAAVYLGPPTPEQTAHIATVDARRSELDQRYGTYSTAHAKDLVKQVYKDYPAVRSALTSHLNGGGKLTPATVATEVSDKSLSKAERLEQAKKGLQALREISEWSLLHQPTTTREGTIRLFHGANAEKDAVTKWETRLSSSALRRGTPMTDHWSVARQFADSGPSGTLVVSAQVPAAAILIWHGIRGDSDYAWEHEFTLGTGAIQDYTILDLKNVPKEPTP